MVPTKKPLSERKTGLLIAVIGGFIGGPIGLLASPLALYLLTHILKARDGHQPNRFMIWAFIGVIGAPLCILPFSDPPSNTQASSQRHTNQSEYTAKRFEQAIQRGDRYLAVAFTAGLMGLGASATAIFFYSKNRKLLSLYGPITKLEQELLNRRLEAEEESRKFQESAELQIHTKIESIREEARIEEIKLKGKIENLEQHLLKLNNDARNEEKRFEDITRANQEAQDQARARINALNLDLSEARKQLARLKSQREKEEILVRQTNEALLSAQEAIEEEQELRAIGFHPRRYPDLRSIELEQKLNSNRKEQKKLGSAILKNTSKLSSLRVDGSIAKGRAMQKRSLSLYLRGFNGECDTLVNSVKHGNINTVHRMIANAFNFYKNQASDLQLPWPDNLLSLRLEEADLVHENSLAKQIEREEQARIREEMREEARALREMEEAQKTAQREAERLKQLLEKERKDAERSKLDDFHKQRISELEHLLKEAEANKQRAMSRSQMTRSGHVYVISNIGSFGEGIYKVGMTRRLDPMDRVRELGDASVPFPFDVHAIIFTDDAPGLENLIHNEIEAYRLNLINRKREFFAISQEDLKSAIDKAAASANIQYRVLWTRYAEAEQYRQSLRERER